MLPSPTGPLTETSLCYSLGLNLQVAKLRMVFSGSKVFTPLEQWFSFGGDFALRGHLAKSGEFLVVVCVCVCCWHLASSGLRPGIPLNILQCMGQVPTTEDHPGHDANCAEAETPCIIKLPIEFPNDYCRPLHYIPSVWKTREKVHRGESCINTISIHHSILGCQIQMNTAGVQTQTPTFYRGDLEPDTYPLCNSRSSSVKWG